MTSLFEMLSRIVPLSEEFKTALQETTVSVSLPKSHMLLDLAMVAQHVYFLDAGFAMSFTYRDGKKHIEEFYPAGKIIASPKSLFEQSPAKESIQLLVQSEVTYVSYQNVLTFFKTYAEANTLYRAMMIAHYEESRKRIHDLQYLKASERYNKLLRSYPMLEQLVPQEYIASYLGITPQSLGRIKKGARGN